MMMMTNPNDDDYIVVERHNETDLRFQGEQIAHVSSRKSNGPSSQRWTELTLYKTVSGKYVVQKIGYSLWENESDMLTAHVCDDHEQIIKALGQGWLSKELYFEAGIDAAEDI